MKRLIFSVSILFTVAVICVALNVVLHKTAQDFSEMSEKYVFQAQESNMKVCAQKLEELWDERKAFISIFSPSEIYKEADFEIRRLKYSVSLEEFKRHCRETAELVRRAAGEDIPKIENIF